jgi:hypothetical protein
MIPNDAAPSTCLKLVLEVREVKCIYEGGSMPQSIGEIFNKQGHLVSLNMRNMMWLQYHLMESMPHLCWRCTSLVRSSQGACP